ncbi:hypothetical protein [Haladaptatus sp. R4]|uniref:hypothetical protein n=1 Tax=Haladaptatus sp. R4 TaxID=1679489 RepID=UPI001CBB5D50|nr:hypothetical protein [Haladaptatus sp. R4]
MDLRVRILFVQRSAEGVVVRAQVVLEEGVERRPERRNEVVGVRAQSLLSVR